MSSVDNLNRIEVEQPQEIIDFRMISFSLGGRDYGIDIMDVKEISKIENITYVPNTLAYVRGVYNLRGEIISIIDLRTMFNLPIVPKDEEELDDVLFLESGERVIGVIVDQVNDVVGVSSERIQPPPPVFEEINIRYIRGVVESADILFVILDTGLVFGEDIQDSLASDVDATTGSSLLKAAEATEAAEIVATPVPEVKATASEDELDYSFVVESLESFSSFYTSNLNEAWVKSRFTEWSADRTSKDLSVQLQSIEDSTAFLSTFYSASRSAFWSSEFMAGFGDLLPAIDSNAKSAWVVGAGDGFDAYSLTCVLFDKYPDASVSVWAHDADLLKVSSAPTLLVDPSAVPREIANRLMQTPNGHMFSNEIRKSLYFEYHDVNHDNTFPTVQVIVARDFLSFLTEQARLKLMSVFREKLASGGVVLVGDNEKMPESEWNLLESQGVRCYASK